LLDEKYDSEIRYIFKDGKHMGKGI
jgi:hypothetical protein